MTVRLTSQLLRSPRVQRSAPVAVEIAYRRWLSWGKFRSVIPRSRMQYSVSRTVGRLATCTALVESLEIHVNFQRSLLKRKVLRSTHCTIALERRCRYEWPECHLAYHSVSLLRLQDSCGPTVAQSCEDFCGSAHEWGRGLLTAVVMSVMGVNELL